MAKEFKRGSKDNKDKKSGSGKAPKKREKTTFERYRDESRPSDFGSSAPKRTSSYEGKRPAFGDKPAFRKKRDDDRDERPSYDKKDERPSFNKDRKPFGDKPAFRKTRDDDREKPSYDKKEEKPSFRDRKPFGDKPASSGPAKRYNSDDRKGKPFGDKPAFKKRDDDRDEKPSFKKKNHDDDFYESKPAFVRESDVKNFDYEAEYQALKKGGAGYDEYRKKRAEIGAEKEVKPKKSFGSDRENNENYSRPYKKKTFGKKSFDKSSSSSSKPHKTNDDGSIRLNKYIANAGICSRREADELIESGVVQVNGKIITEMGFKVKSTDVIKYGGQTLKKERLVYLILNKPKDYITTVDDPQQRRTVLELIQGACRERVYPVGRLDRATTGLLMFTNDGELTKKLTHPRYGVRKVYHIELDKPLKKADLEKIAEGIELEDGPIKVDEITYVGDGKDKANVGVEIHSGKNRIVRRIFESFGYNVRKLDRVVFGPLTKKDMPRGRWRLLTEAEVGMMKMISSGE